MAKKEDKSKQEKKSSAGKRAQAKEPMVVLIPGLLNPKHIMLRMYWAVRRMGRRATLFGYPSFRRDIPDNARRLAAFLRDLDEKEVDIICFSTGGIILRWAVNHFDTPKIRRVVMVGVPNQGAEMASILHQKFGVLFPLTWGKCALQLRKGDDGLAARAGLMPEGTEIGIIAGGKGNDRGRLPIVQGDNDRVVAVAETIISGMDDFILIDTGHSGLVLTGKSTAMACQFLKTGKFRNKKSSRIPVEDRPDSDLTEKESTQTS